jgi:hypothetical protein
MPFRPTFPPTPKPGSPTSGGGGGSGGGGSSGGAAADFSNSNGGVLAAAKAVFFPCYSLVDARSVFCTLNPLNGYNDPINGSFYFWRVEQVKPYQQYTIRRIVFTFRDMGQVSVTWTLSAVTDAMEVVTKQNFIGFGNKVPTYREMTIKADLILTGMNMQLSVYRAPNAGPLSLIQVMPVGQMDSKVTL